MGLRVRESRLGCPLHELVDGGRARLEEVQQGALRVDHDGRELLPRRLPLAPQEVDVPERQAEQLEKRRVLQLLDQLIDWSLVVQSIGQSVR